ncbi:valine--tRNA ligase [Candidatus Pacearchaeota archaeon]|nr:valine--tRNA ligase [Candidatus Pacearchaeota archaeon]
MAKSKFDFKGIEEKWRKFWENQGIYKFDAKRKEEIFSVDTPPPYISGRMHIGHAFSYSQQDFIIRFMRMKGKNIFYPFGTDDNGLPTERFIEKENKVKSKDMGRSKFIALCLKTLKKVTPICIKDFRDLGISSDYDIYYSTIDKHSQKVSQKSFIDLVKKKEAYKKEFPTLWCPECQTSIAQAELEDKEETSLFSTLKFKCNKKDLLVATTRPELLGACVAVFVNPLDKRYKTLVGKKAKVPLFNQEVPILEDKSAEIDKGTGVLMICSYGDRFDVDAINRHGLNPKIVLEKDGTLNIGKYKGLKIKDARKKILEDLKKEGLIKEKKEISHVLNCHDKCGTGIEFLPTEQWFIKILDKKDKLIAQGNKINWYPEFMHKRYDNWVNGLEWDWSISRNRHFGIPIPVWECSCGEIILPSENELPVDPLQVEKKCPKCHKIAEPEKMVLDTWATSSMTPQIAAELAQAKGRIGLPFSFRPQAHDIIRTWAFYTIVKSYLHEKEIPWKDIVISGFVTLGGEKMSKSKGNVLDPIKIMEEYGADALRFAAASSKLGNDLDYQEKDLVTGKKMITKLMNASRFVFMNLEGWDGSHRFPRDDLPKREASVYTKEVRELLRSPKTLNSGAKQKKLEKLDELFLNKLDYVVNEAGKNFEKYEYSKVKQEIESFFWNDFCDNYLEIVKKRVYQGEGDKKLSAQYTLYKSLLAILKMIAPIMPFVTEEIYQEHFKKIEKDKSIHISSWPRTGKFEDSNKDLSLFYEVLSNVRQEKTKNQKSMNAECILTINKTNYGDLKEMLDDLKNVTNAKEIKEGKQFKVGFLE